MAKPTATATATILAVMEEGLCFAYNTLCRIQECVFSSVVGEREMTAASNREILCCESLREKFETPFETLILSQNNFET